MIDGKWGKCVAEHTAVIFDRGGARRVGPLLDVSYVQYERDRDDTSEGIVRLQGRACSEQAEFIASLRTHRHELVIYRNGQRVWEGPLHRITSRGSFAELVAKDVSIYLFGQPLTQEYSNVFPKVGTVTGRLEDIINYEFTNGRVQNFEGSPVIVPAWEDLDPPVNIIPHLDVHHFPNEARTSARTVPFQMTVGEHLDSLSQDAGIDWTVVGRAIHIWDVSRANGFVRDLTEADFESDVIVTEYGADHAQAAYSVGQNGAYGSAISVEHLDYYGPWTQIHTVYQEEGTPDPGQPELDGQARRNISGRSPSPVEVRVPDNSSVILSDTLTMEMLVPGAQLVLRATMNARNLTQLQKIDYVRVVESDKGEKVTITLMPASRPDLDEVVVP